MPALSGTPLISEDADHSEFNFEDNTHLSRMRILINVLRCIGQGFIISIGYMDPGNWSTDIAAGSQFKYKLLHVVLLSNILAIVLQYLSIRLGVFTSRGLAKLTRESIQTKWLWIPMYLVAEVAIIACDLAEVIGSAIGLKLLFGIPISLGIIITSADVIILLMGLDANGNSTIEIVLTLTALLISSCLLADMFMAKPQLSEIVAGFLPSLKILEKDPLFISLGIIGATVMPHNLYLQSDMVAKNNARHHFISLKEKVTHLTMGTIFALCFAFLINCAILITASASFTDRKVDSLEEAAALLEGSLGKSASIVFSVALLFAGQSSSVTGTLAGQIVVESFFDMKIKPWMRRLITRSCAILPALIVVLSMGEASVQNLLVWSQVILSLQLPFAVVPLVYFTSSKEWMGLNKNPTWLTVTSILVASIIIMLNFALLFV
ncbi:putative manganese transport protein, Nramp family [Rozella allomycis CSF55]|uniref:Putative manganese transport protein, Nramp family n=1 Tax=Rozella allomycis (strain CSF55) TaxID=988480 RepID=A0A4P9YM70_ROZAC|nr:putative manganese transport protein, Nramp family [Rozella allomycis CSF55]